MKKRALFPGMICCAFMILIILDAKCALSSAREGVNLSVHTVIPSLFPLFFLSAYINASLLGVDNLLFKPLGRFCGIPAGCEPLLLIGLIGGYPVGAKNIQCAYKSGQLSQKESLRMLSFCNNAGPAFIFGFLSPLFENKWHLMLLWGIHILSAILTSTLMPDMQSKERSLKAQETPNVAAAMESALHSILLVCGWVIVFRVIIGFCQRWFLWLLPKTAQVILSGVLELTNGCVLLSEISSPALRFLIAELFLSFGGLCVLMQTSAVCAPLPIISYVKGKLIQTVISLFLTLSVLPFIFGLPVALSVSATIPLLLILIKKVVAFTGNVRYNKEKSLQ